MVAVRALKHSLHLLLLSLVGDDGKDANDRSNLQETFCPASLWISMQVVKAPHAGTENCDKLIGLVGGFTEPKTMTIDQSSTNSDGQQSSQHYRNHAESRKAGNRRLLYISSTAQHNRMPY